MNPQLICPVPKKGDLSAIQTIARLVWRRFRWKSSRWGLLNHLNAVVSLSPSKAVSWWSTLQVQKVPGSSGPGQKRPTCNLFVSKIYAPFQLGKSCCLAWSNSTLRGWLFRILAHRSASAIIIGFDANSREKSLRNLTIRPEILHWFHHGRIVLIMHRLLRSGDEKYFRNLRIERFFIPCVAIQF